MMKINKLLVCVVALAGFAMTGCGGVEGTYKLDKASTKKAMEGEIAKMPADQQGMAKIGLAMIDAMDMTLELKSGGVVTTKSSMPNLLNDKAPPKTDEDTGTWKKEGDTISITGSKGDKNSFSCTKAGKKLTCKDPKSKENMALIFEKS
jgi:hypothetical protein